MAQVLSRRSIANIKPGDADIVLIGSVLACQTPRQTASHDVSSTRCAFNFTLRDSLEDTVNVTFWGRETDIQSVYTLCKIGSLVQVCNPKLKQDSTYNCEMYRPRVTNHTELVVTDVGSIKRYMSSGPNDPVFQKFQQFASIPPPNLMDIYTLVDVLYNRASLEGQFVNLLVGIKQMKEPSSIQTKFGQKTKQDLDVFDRTGSGLVVTLWDEPLQEFAINWLPYQTVLLLAGVKLSFNAFQQKLVANTCSRTICIVQPDCEAGKALAAYVRSAASLASLMDEPEQDPHPRLDLNSIKLICNIRQLKDKLLTENQLEEWQQSEAITAILYPAVNSMDLDGPILPVISKCANCFGTISDENGFLSCDKPPCSDLFFSSEASKAMCKRQFSIKVQLVDHSGMLNCWLNGRTAERVLGVTVEEYMAMNHKKKTELKWRFLLKYFKVGVSVKLVNGSCFSSFIVGVEEAHPMEIASKTPV